MSGLYARDLDPEEFLKVVEETTWPKDSILMAFSPAQARFSWFRYDATFLRSSDQGRIFSPAGELKWRRLDDKFRVIYLGETIPSLGLADHSALLKDLQPEQGELILWGVRTDRQDEWIEQQVPQRFVYPVSGEKISRGRVELVVENWLDSHGLPQFSRYHSLKECQGERHASG
ncbi:MAG: hypothetical protein JRI50_09100 [Deltaproteobacteria bacterium]|nr:hypothetical protein [Deltaproteobacteria bacterium]MBW2135652.1 hypothetical protein [Deltaproteobacteria bacterium]